MTPAEVDPNEHILVVEDDRDLRDTLAEALRLEGYEVVSAEHGEAALRHLRSGARPCMVLLDLMMPVMDGWTLRREMLKDAALAAIPVVVMTAAGAGRAAGVEATVVVHKPLVMDDLVALVEAHCPHGAN
ncbi:MAG TPA: response regulator [Polyangia bacterium]|nr:response regulator [Polyangia bacterium]